MPHKRAVNGPFLRSNFGLVSACRPCVSARPAGHTDSVRHDDVTITPYRDGPLLIRGPFTLRDQDGNDVTVDRDVVALCRCGKSRQKPFCDGTHKISGFRAESGLPET